VVVIGRTSDGFYLNPLDKVSDSSQHRFYPEVYRRSKGQKIASIDQLGQWTRPVYRELFDEIAFNEKCIGVKEIWCGVSSISFEITQLYIHRRAPIALIALELLGKHTGRPLNLILVRKDWTEREIGLIRNSYPEVIIVEDFAGAQAMLFDLENPES
jgi:hypothetical protein